MSDQPTDQELTAAAEAIIERVAALRPDHDYETNGLVWAVASYAVGLQSIIDEARVERDRLQAVVDALREWNAANARLLIADTEEDEDQAADALDIAGQEVLGLLAALDVSSTGEDT